MSDAVWQSLITDVFAPMLLSLCASLGLWVATKLPGPLSAWLSSGTHARDVALLVGAMGRKAVVDVADHRTPPPSPADIIRYAEMVLPSLLAKMQLTPLTLETMAGAAIRKAEVVEAAAAAPVVPLLDPSTP